MDGPGLRVDLGGDGAAAHGGDDLRCIERHAVGGGHELCGHLHAGCVGGCGEGVKVGRVAVRDGEQPVLRAIDPLGVVARCSDRSGRLGAVPLPAPIDDELVAILAGRGIDGALEDAVAVGVGELRRAGGEAVPFARREDGGRVSGRVEGEAAQAVADGVGEGGRAGIAAGVCGGVCGGVRTGVGARIGGGVAAAVGGVVAGVVEARVVAAAAVRAILGAGICSGVVGGVLAARRGVCRAGILCHEEADRRSSAAVVEAVEQAIFVVVEAVVAAPLAQPFVGRGALLDDRTGGETEEGGEGEEVALRHA